MSQDACPWLQRDGYFRRIVGFEQAVHFSNDVRLHADFAGLFGGVGSVPAPVMDILQTSLLSINGPEHRRLRTLISSRFSPRAVEHVRPSARSAARRLAEGLVAEGGGEFVAVFAEPYVAAGTCAHIGFPLKDRGRFIEPINRLSWATKDLQHRLDDAVLALEVLADYSREMLAWRTREPADDVLTYVAGLLTERTISETVAVGLVAGFLSAGHEPTVNQLGIMIEVLTDHPEVWDAVGTGALPVTRVVEEVLRFRSTNQGVNRLVTEPIDYQGQHFPQGRQVLIGVAAANHDPLRFDDPEVFDPAAGRPPHLAFGIGPHHCLGAALARLQLQAGLAALTGAMRCPEVVSVDAETGGGLVGPSQLLLRCTAR